MAPIYMNQQVLEAAGVPGLAFLSVVILFILSITLLALCTVCQRQSFTPDSGAVNRNPSTLVRVVKPGDATVIPASQSHLALSPEDLQLGPNQQYKVWRSHTLERTQHLTVNGGVVTP